METHFNEEPMLQDAISLTRVSTTKQELEGESQDDQEVINQRIAKAKNFRIVKSFREDYSGRKDYRPVLEEVYDYLKNHPNIKAAFFRDINRLTRGGSEKYSIIKRTITGFGVQIFDTIGIIQPTRNTLDHLGFTYDWSERSPSQIAEIIRAETANQEVSDILTRTIGAEIQLAQKGYNVRKPIIGFDNVKVEDDLGKKKVIGVPNKEESKWIKRIYQLKCQAHLSDLEICKEVNKMGFRTRIMKKRDSKTRKVIGIKGGNPLTPKLLDKIVQNPTYCGIRIEKWTHNKPVRLAYPGLVTISEFNKANRGRIKIHESEEGLFVDYDQNRKKRLLYNPQYPLRFVVKCPICGNNLTGSASTGKSGKSYPAYHCHAGGHYFRVPLKEFNSQIEAYLSSLKFDKKYYPLFEKAIYKIWESKKGNIEQNIENQPTTLKDKQDVLFEKLLSTQSTVVQKKLEKEIEILEERIVQEKQQHTKRVTLTKEKIDSYLQEVKNYVEHPKNLLLNQASPEFIIQVWNLVFEELPTYESIVCGTPQLSPLYSLCDGSNTTEKSMVTQVELNWNRIERAIEKTS